MKSIGKATHRSTVGSLAYRSGVMLKDEKTGEVENYRKKQVSHVELILPEGSPVLSHLLESGPEEVFKSGL